MINCQELETATRYEIPVVVLILNDNAFGFIKWEQKKMNFEDFGWIMEILTLLFLRRVLGLQALRLEKVITLQKFWRDLFP